MKEVFPGCHITFLHSLKFTKKEAEDILQISRKPFSTGPVVQEIRLEPADVEARMLQVQMTKYTAQY